MDERKSKTLFVRNLPFSATNEKLSEVFGEIGPIKTAFVVKQKDADQCKGYGYVKFSMLEDAAKAKEALKSFEGRKIFTSYADAKKSRKPPKATDVAEKKVANIIEENAQTAKEGKAKVITEDKAQGMKKGTTKGGVKEKTKGGDKEKTKAAVERDKKSGVEGKAKCAPGENTKGRRQGRKAKRIAKDGQEDKQVEAKSSGKHCRLIIRNLSFKCEAKDLKAAFEKFGELTDVNMPTKTDGRKCGFGFVQFDKLSCAEVAIAEMNAKEILGRPVAVDWAVPKDRYVKSEVQQKKDSTTDLEESCKEGESEDGGDEEAKSDDSLEMKDKSDAEENPDAELMDTEIEEEEEEEEKDDDEEEEEKEEDGDDDGNEEEQGEEDDEGFEEEESSSYESDVDEKKKQPAKDEKQKDKKVPRKSDVEEGRTLFVRNVPFDADEEDLTELFQEFGELVYIRLVLDPLTEHPKGTAFVQFRTKEAADRCLEKVQDGNANPGLMCNGRRLLVALAVTRSEAQAQKTVKKQKEEKDSRNLFLACEGMIRPGTKAAEGISAEDMSKRMKTEQLKRERLKNQNIFVSSTRLCVHNLPTHVDDKTLRKTLLDVLGDSSARITECRVMRDMARKNAKSLGFAFVNFTKHEHALAALRKTNNNPAIFGDKKRPIVEFSLENRKALEAKQRRLEKSKLKQERRDLKRAASEGIQRIDSKEIPPGKKAKMSASSLHGVSKAGKNREQDKIAKQQHTGPKSLPKHFGPKLRHRDRQKLAEQKAKAKKKNKPVKKTGPKQPPATLKKKKKNDSDSFDKLVASYKQKFLKGARTKWCD